MRDPMTSRLTVAQFAIDKLVEHLHEGLEPLPTEVLIITHKQARNAQTYQAARTVADERGIELRIADSVSGEVERRESGGRRVER